MKKLKKFLKKRGKFAVILGLLIFAGGLFFVSRSPEGKNTFIPIYGPQGSPRPVLEKEKLKERNPIQPPQGWRTYSINGIVSISVPKEWFLLPRSFNSETGDKNYTFSNLSNLKSYQDWNSGEKFRIHVGIHHFADFDEEVNDEINVQLRSPVSLKVAPYTLETFLTNGHRVARFEIDGGDITIIDYSQIVELEKDKLLEIRISLWEGVPEEQRSFYMDQFKLMLDSLTIKAD